MNNGDAFSQDAFSAAVQSIITLSVPVAPSNFSQAKILQSEPIVENLRRLFYKSSWIYKTPSTSLPCRLLADDWNDSNWIGNWLISAFFPCVIGGVSESVPIPLQLLLIGSLISEYK